MKKVVTLLTGLFLMIAIAAFAGTAKSSKSNYTKTTKTTAETKTHQATGTISSVDANSLTLSHKVKGKEEQTTFVMNDQTKKEGDLKSGEKVTVHYKKENDQNVATIVRASGKMAHNAHAAAPSSSGSTK